MAASILHRASGIILAIGLPVLALWIVSVAAGGDVASDMAAILGSWLGHLALFGWTLALSYHLLNGLRHLCLDAGLGFSKETAHRSGWAVIVGAAILALIIWVVALLA